MGQLDVSVDPRGFARNLRPMAEPLPLDPPDLLEAAETADTFGWDTVFAITFVETNAAIKAAKSSPTTLSVKHEEAGHVYQLEGSFGDWELDTGGDGRNARFAIPLDTLVYTENGAASSFSNVLLGVVFAFGFQPSRDESIAQKDGNGWMDLRVDASQGATVTSIQFLDGDDPGILAFIIKGLIETWFNDPENIGAFSHVFGSVNLNAKAASDDFQWLMPTDLGYAVVDRGSLENSIFAILCMTEGRERPDAGHQVSPFAIPDGYSSGFLISKERFLEKMLLPGIGMLFTGPTKPTKGKQWPQDYFEVDPDEGAITNKSGIYIGELEVGDGGKYRAEIGERNFTVRLYNTYLQTEIIDMQHEYKHLLSWLHVYHTIQSRSTARLTGQSFDLLPGNGNHHVVVTKDKTAEWIEIGLLAASLVAVGVFAAAKGWLTVSSRVASTSAEAASITSETIVTGAPTAAQSSSMASEGASVALSSLRNGVLKGADFLKAYQVTNRASVVSAMAGTAFTVMKALDVLADIDSQGSSLPKFNEFAAKIMAPIRWPNQASHYNVDLVAFNGLFQIAGRFGGEEEPA